MFRPNFTNTKPVLCYPLIDTRSVLKPTGEEGKAHDSDKLAAGLITEDNKATE